MKLFASTVLACAVAQMPCGGDGHDPSAYPRPCPPEPVTYQWCRDNYVDYIGQDADNNGSEEIKNPSRQGGQPRDNWEEEFRRLASRLLDQQRPVADNGNQGMTNKEISLSLLSYMQNLWPMDGWVIVVANANGYGETVNGDGTEKFKCKDYNGISDAANPDYETCFDHWYTGCREKPYNGSSSKQCRNEIVQSSSKHRVAIGVQVNKRIEHMEHVDHDHVMWWASHAEGCEENVACAPLGDNPTESLMKAQIQSKYGVSGKDLDLRQGPMRRMSAKLIWQHYRQALDKEFLYINDDSCANWDTLITFCSDNTAPDSNGQWGDIAWEKVNIDNHYHHDYQQFEIGLKEDWYGNNGVAQCVTIYVTPFSH